VIRLTAPSLLRRVKRWLLPAGVFVLLMGAALAAPLRIPTGRTPPTPSRTPGQLPALDGSIFFRPTRTPTPPVATPTTIPTATPYLTATPSPTPTPADGVWFEIGRSAGGRPLEVARFGRGPVERLIVAGIHGGYEWNTIALADELADHLRAHPEWVPANISLYILRSLNPDGAARAANAYGRGNDNGVDLNRNWDANWLEDWNRSGCFTSVRLTAGSAPESEPEVQALAEFIRAHTFDALISYHSAGLGIFAGGIDPTRASRRLATALSQISFYPYPPVYTGCQYSGQLIDWAAAQGMAAVDVELSSHTELDWAVNLRVLNAFLNWSPE